jgi:uncharacterized protein
MRTLKPRHPELALADLPRHWFGGNALATQIVNGVNLLFPDGERFFVRSVKKVLDRLDAPDLVQQARGFFGQEGRHAHAHEDFFATMRAQGYQIDRFLALYEKVTYETLERRLPEMVNLAGTAACEHFTAILAEGVLEGGVLDEAHPEMRRLLLWHAAEEIEHRAVAFDVFARAGGTYAQRMAGLALVTLFLGGWWLVATTMLLAQDRRSLRALRADGQQILGRRGLLRRVFVRGIRDYMRRDFHPLDRDLDGLARRYLEEAGLAV